MVEQIVTFKDMQDAIIDRAKLADKESVRGSIKEFLNTANQLVTYEEDYRWAAETRPLVLKAKYTTGTVTVTNGSDVVTGSSASFTRFEHERCKFYVTGVNRAFTILHVDESNQRLVLDSPWTGTTAAGSSYTIFKDEYGLFPDLRNIRKLWIPGSTFRTNPCGPDYIDDFRSQRPTQAGLPKLYSISGLNIYTAKTWATFNLGTDFFEDDFDVTPQNLNLIVWPAILTTNNVAMIRYTQIAYKMSADADTPRMPVENRPRLVYEVLCEHFIKERDRATKSEWENMRMTYKKRMANDIESTDDDLVLQVDHTDYRRNPFYYNNEDREI